MSPGAGSSTEFFSPSGCRSAVRELIHRVGAPSAKFRGVCVSAFSQTAVVDTVPRGPASLLFAGDRPGRGA